VATPIAAAAECLPLSSIGSALVPDRILVFYGSYRSDRQGIRLADYLVNGFVERGAEAELIDAKAVGLPMLDRMYKEYSAGEAPEAMEQLAAKLRSADAFVFVTGEYNWGQQPGLKNLTDHFLEEWFWRPAAIASYSAGRLAGSRANYVWHNTLSEMGMVVISSTLTVGSIGHAINESRSATVARQSSEPSRSSPMISLGGLPRHASSVRAPLRLTE
jgi:NAD(P)H-dependent FMN reductase